MLQEHRIEEINSTNEVEKCEVKTESSNWISKEEQAFHCINHGESEANIKLSTSYDKSWRLIEADEFEYIDSKNSEYEVINKNLSKYFSGLNINNDLRDIEDDNQDFSFGHKEVFDESTASFVFEKTIIDNRDIQDVNEF